MNELFETHWASLVRTAGPGVFSKSDRETARLFYAHGRRDSLRQQMDNVRTELESLDRLSPGKSGSESK